jgi:SAM-dependent methyltransferase
LKTDESSHNNSSNSPRLKRGAVAYRRKVAHYLNLLIPPSASVLEIGCGSGILLSFLKASRKAGIEVSNKLAQQARFSNPGSEIDCADVCLLKPTKVYDYIVIADTLNHTVDAQALLEHSRRFASANARLIVSTCNGLWRPILSLLTWLGLRDRQPLLNWLAPEDIKNLAELAGWERIKTIPRILVPAEIPLLSAFLNRWIAPLVSCLCLANIAVFRKSSARLEEPSVSIVIPARNEAGNINDAVRRIPPFARDIELVFVEGHSSDDTWDRIQKVQSDNLDKKILIARQTGRGKGDAVRLGFSMATGDILMILDADLTMPPEDLPKFYQAVASGHCEFANGCRLVYPMEKEAMQFLNLCANKLFGILFSWLLGQHVKDTLCGTKVLTRCNYEAIAANRDYFGDFDPFGDFDLLFGADKLNLKIRDIPVRYRERMYGSTNIQRFRHGVLLFRMVGFAARKLRFI